MQAGELANILEKFPQDFGLKMICETSESSTQEQDDILKEVRYSQIAESCDCREYFLESIEEACDSIESFLDSINERYDIAACRQDLLDFMNNIIYGYDVSELEDEFGDKNALNHAHFNHCLYGEYCIFIDSEMFALEQDLVAFYHLKYKS